MRHFFPLDDLWEVTGRAWPCFTLYKRFPREPYCRTVWLLDGRHCCHGTSPVRGEQHEEEGGYERLFSPLSSCSEGTGCFHGSEAGLGDGNGLLLP